MLLSASGQDLPHTAYFNQLTDLHHTLNEWREDPTLASAYMGVVDTMRQVPAQRIGNADDYICYDAMSDL